MGVQHRSDLWPRLRHRVFGRQREPGRCCRKCGHRLDEARETERCQECGADLATRGTFDNRPFNRRAIFFGLLAFWTAFIAFCWITMTEGIIERINPREVRAFSIDLTLQPQRKLIDGYLTLIAKRSSERTGDPNADTIESITIRHWGAEHHGDELTVREFDRNAFDAWWMECGFPPEVDGETGAARELRGLLASTASLPFEALWNDWVSRANALERWNGVGMSGATGPYRRRDLADGLVHLIWAAAWLVGLCFLAMVLRPGWGSTTVRNRQFVHRS